MIEANAGQEWVHPESRSLSSSGLSRRLRVCGAAAMCLLLVRHNIWTTLACLVPPVHPITPERRVNIACKLLMGDNLSLAGGADRRCWKPITSSFTGSGNRALQHVGRAVAPQTRSAY
jgi:hypothetical protein